MEAPLTSTDESLQKKETIMNKILGAISGAFAPILGVLAGSGLISALLTILKTVGWISSDSGTFAILSAAGHAIFYFFPVFLGITLANKLGANGYVGGAIGGALLEPHYTELVASKAQDVSFMGIPVFLASYSSTVFPILIAVSIYALLDKFLKKVIYKDLQLFLNPLLTLIIIVPLTVLLFGPFGTYVGEGLAVAIKFLISKSSILTGAVIGSAWSFLTIFGLHWAVIPIFLANLAASGLDPLSPMAAAAPFAQMGLALGVLFKTRDKGLKTLAASGLVPSALAGTTEIITYGILVRYKRSWAIVAISGAIGGALNGALGVKGTGFALPSFMSIPVFTPMVLFMAGTIASLLIALFLTMIFGYESREEKISARTVKEFGLAPVSRETLLSPLAGEIIPLSKLAAPLFSTGTVGKGIAIDPFRGEIVSPVNGIVTTLFPTDHAIGITSDHGAEILIYVGFNTIHLKGEHFTAHVNQWDKVKKGDLLIEFDLEEIKARGYDVRTPVVITNTDQYLDVVPVKEGMVKAQDEILRLKV